MALSAVDRKPVRAVQLEDFLKGQKLNDELLQSVDGLVAKETRLMSSSIDPISYKRKIMGELVKGALREPMGGK